jgi:hypothetical protein
MVRAPVRPAHLAVGLAMTLMLEACGQAAARPVAAPSSASQTLAFDTAGWKTDFSKHSVPLSEIMGGGPPRDGIPPIDHPKFQSVSQADWLASNEPVIAFSEGDDHRAYPLEVLIWHEIANDTVGGVPVVVTFCPLCNTAIALDRRVDGRVLDFGTTGNLRKSDLVMWDRQTESWWQQIAGEAIVGALTGKSLNLLPASIISWGDFKRAFPSGRVLSKDTGFDRPYGKNPYVGYDNVGQRPFLYSGPIDGRLAAMERVVSVSFNGEDVAYPFGVLQKRRVISDKVGGRSVVVLFKPGTNSALDGASISNSRDVGEAAVFDPEANDQMLTFRATADGFIDDQTGSQWNILGQAVSGPLAGSQLQPIVSGNHFWFAWAAFKPHTRIFK